MNPRAPDPLSSSCDFDELQIRARSPWYRDQYNRELEYARSLGLPRNQARAYAIHKMTPLMNDSLNTARTDARTDSDTPAHP